MLLSSIESNILFVLHASEKNAREQCVLSTNQFDAKCFQFNLLNYCLCISFIESITKMLPLSLLKTARNQPMLVELKNGETYNGNLASCDAWMNLHLRGEVYCTSKDGESFWKMPEVYIRGSMIKYLRLPDEILDKAKRENFNHKRVRQF